MSGNTKDGGPAFPGGSVAFDDGDVTEPNFPGMTLRDWFAGQALVGLASTMENWRFMRIREGHAQGEAEASVAYSIADSMLAARDKGL